MRDGPDLLDTFGLRPVGPALVAIRRAILGTSGEPRTQIGLSSARIFKPWIGIPAWLGVRPRDRLTPIYNLFNRTPQPRDEAYSVRVSYARDFLGGRFTYDGHLGTDFALPVGTPIVASAPGLVLRVGNDLDRGGLKVCVDHGEGLFTTSSHLSRAVAAVGDVVRRGQVVGLSGASGVEFVTMFPWVSPHLHFNTWLDSTPVDPFALASEASLWRSRNDPQPHPRTPESAASEAFEPTRWDTALVDAAVAACRHDALRRTMAAITDVSRRAAEVIVQRNYRAVLFTAFPPLYPRAHDRTPRLDLPLLPAAYDGASLRGRRVGEVSPAERGLRRQSGRWGPSSGLS